MPVLKITWYTHIDERTCPLCAPLHNHEWMFDTEKDPFPEYLVAPMGGPPVWDCQKDEPLTHGPASRRGPWNCRCTLTWQMDDVDLSEAIDALAQNVKSRMQLLLGVTESWSGVGEVTVVRSEKGRFVTWSKKS